MQAVCDQQQHVGNGSVHQPKTNCISAQLIGQTHLAIRKSQASALTQTGKHTNSSKLFIIAHNSSAIPLSRGLITKAGGGDMPTATAWMYCLHASSLKATSEEHYKSAASTIHICQLL
jgi:hypothetical protein